MGSTVRLGDLGGRIWLLNYTVRLAIVCGFCILPRRIRQRNRTSAWLLSVGLASLSLRRASLSEGALPHDCLLVLDAFPEPLCIDTAQVRAYSMPLPRQPEDT